MLGKYAIAATGLGAACIALPSIRSAQPDTFAQSAQTATARLEAKHRTVLGTGLGQLTIAFAGTAGDALTIGVRRAGNPAVVTCRVMVAAATPRSSTAATDCSQADGDGSARGRLRAAAMNIVMREHVAATIADRPYDTDRVADRMIALAIANPGVAAAGDRAGQH